MLLVEESVDFPGQKWPTAGLEGASPPPYVQQAPQEFAATAANPALENSHEWRDLSAGYGLRLQVGINDRRYRYARRADLSIANQWMLGPELTKLTPSAVDGTNGCSKFFELGGKLYLCNGRYVQLRTSDVNWDTGRNPVASAGSPVTSAAAAFESGKAALDVVTFYAAGTSNLAYFAMGNSEKIWKFDGATWTQAAGNLYSRAWCVEGQNLWRASADNQVSKVDVAADPFVLANWSADNLFTIGDASSPINSMIMTASGVMLFMKTDGVYILDDKGADHPLYAGMHFAIDAENGKYPYLAGNFVYVTYGRRHFRIGPNLELEAIGPERYVDNDSLVKGYITRGCETSFANYAGLYNPDTGNSYLMKSTAWGLSPQGQYVKQEDVWHGSLSNFVDSTQPYGAEDFSGVKIQAMAKSQIGAPTGHERLYMADSAGRITWFDLPCTPNPDSCTSYKVATGGVRTGSVWLPYWHARFPNNPKDVRAATGTGVQLSAATPAAYISEIGLRETGSGGNYTGYNDGEGGPFLDVVPSARRAVQGAFTLLDAVVNLYADTDTTSPVVSGIGLSYAVRLPIQQVYPLHMLAEDGLIMRDGRPFPYGVEELKARIKRAAQVDSGVQMYLPDEVLHTLVFGQYTEHTLRDQRLKRHRQVVSVLAVDADTLEGSSVIPPAPPAVGDISITHVDGGTSATTPSESPTTGQLLLFSVRQYLAQLHGGVPTPVVPTVAGLGVTWDQIATSTSGVGGDFGLQSQGVRVTLFRAMGTVTPGVITITASDSSVVGWSLEQAANVDTTGSHGSGAIVQSIFYAMADLFTMPSLAAYSNASNRPFVALAANDDLYNPNVKAIDLVAPSLAVLANIGTNGPLTAWYSSASPPTSLAVFDAEFPAFIGVELKHATS